MFLFVSLLFPSLCTALPFPPDFLCGSLPRSQMQGSQMCTLNMGSCTYDCLPVATTTTTAPTQQVCTPTDMFRRMRCGVHRDGRMGYCVAYDERTSSVVMLVPPCLVNGQLTSNCLRSPRSRMVECNSSG